MIAEPDHSIARPAQLFFFLSILLEVLRRFNGINFLGLRRFVDLWALAGPKDTTRELTVTPQSKDVVNSNVDRAANSFVPVRSCHPGSYRAAGKRLSDICFFLLSAPIVGPLTLVFALALAARGARLGILGIGKSLGATIRHLPNAQHDKECRERTSFSTNFFNPLSHCLHRSARNRLLTQPPQALQITLNIFKAIQWRE